MPDFIEQFVYGPPARLKRLMAALPDGVSVVEVEGGLVLRQRLAPGDDPDAAIARTEAIAAAAGVVCDGHGQPLDEEPADEGRDIQRRTFTARTGIAAGHGFALPLPDGRLGHAVFLGGDASGYLLLEISTLVMDRPATAAAVAGSGRRYRQAILVWHTGFAVRTLSGTSAPLATLPCDVTFRVGIGWPDPDEIARLGRRFGIAAPDTLDGWTRLVLVMAEARETLPGIAGHSLWTARVGRTGKLKLDEDYAPVAFADRDRRPMPWDAAFVEQVTTAIAGGPDIIAAMDRVT
jgi:hypothetical protein